MYRNQILAGYMAAIPEPIKTVKVVAGVIWRDDGKILITRRPTNGRHGGYWEFPGGKVEQGESDKAALAREILEETGLSINVLEEFSRIEHRYPDLQVTLIGIHCEYMGGTPQCIEVDDFTWIEPEEVNQYTFPEANAKLLHSDWKNRAGDQHDKKSL